MSIWQSAVAYAMLQVPVKRKGVHWTKRSSCLVQGSIFARDESDLVFNMSHLEAGFQVSRSPEPWCCTRPLIEALFYTA